jgi:group I intron endonuclease
MGFIYLIRNKVNDKKYIGLTKRTPEVRWKGHKTQIKHGRGCPILRQAVQKYGWEAFEFSVLEDV